MLPLTLEIQMRAMARTLLRGAGACRQRISPAQRRQGSSARAQRKRHVSERYGRAVRLWLKPDWSRYAYAMHMAMAVANSRTNCMQLPLRRQRSQLWRDQLWRTRIEGEACQGQGRAEPAEHKRAGQKLTALRRGLHHAQAAGISCQWVLGLGGWLKDLKRAEKSDRSKSCVFRSALSFIR